MGEYSEWLSGDKSKRSIGKEKAMLGIWADDDDEILHDSFKTKKPLIFQSIDFVSKGEVDFGKSDETETVKSDGTIIKKAAKIVAPKPIAQWEQYTTGFGSKILRKYGWQGGGLGSGGGLVTPIEVKVKSSRMGLGDVSNMVDEVSAYKSRQEDGLADENLQNFSPNWKRTEVNVSKKSVSSSHVKKQRTVYQMQKSENKSASTIEDVGYQSFNVASELSSANRTFLPELPYNISQLINLYSENLVSCVNQIEMTRSKLEYYAKENKKLELLATERRKKFNNLQNLKQLVILMESKLESAELSCDETLDVLEQFWRLITNKYSEEYVKYKMDYLALHFVFPVLKELMVDWKPLEDPTRGFSSFEKWIDLLCEDKKFEDEFDNFLKLSQSEKLDAGDYMILKIILPQMENSLSEEWQVTMPWTAISLLQTWKNLLGKSWSEKLLHNTVVPKIKNFIKNWKPSSIPLEKDVEEYEDELFRTVSPWWTYVGSLLNDSFRQKIQQLSLELEANEFYSIIKPWKNHLNEKQWNQIAVRAVLPKIELNFRKLIIDPANQSLDHWKQAYTLKPLVSNDAFALSLETSGFWNNWFKVLGQWVHQEDADFSEIHDWFKFWKNETLFGSEAFEHYSIKTQFRHAMSLISDTISNETPPLEQFKPLISTRSESNNERTQKHISYSDWLNVSIKEVVSKAVEDSGLLLLPSNRKHDGNTIYSINNVLVYFSADLMFANLGDGKWTPSSVESVLSRVIQN